MPFNRKIAYYIFFIGLFGLAAAIPVSKAATSIGMFLMAIAWIVQWNWKEKAAMFKWNKRLVLLLVPLFLVFVFGLIHSENINYALKDLKIKVPFFILPILFSTSFPLKRVHIITVLVLMSVSAIAATIIGYIGYQINSSNTKEIINLRTISPFISLIRLSLILSMTFGLALWGIMKLKTFLKWLLILPVFWIVFIFAYSESLTGLIFLPIISVYFIVYILKKWRKTAITFTILGLLVGVFVVIEAYSISKLVFTENTLYAETTTANGRKYERFVNSGKENGFYVYRHICHQEMSKEWNKRSSIKYWSKKKDGFNFNSVIFRYMSSRGLKKDSLGLSQLTDDEISSIELGVTNSFYLESNSISKRIHKLFREIEDATQRGRFKGNSVTSRYIFINTGLKVWKEHFVFGVGTGDVRDKMIEKYQLRSSYNKELFKNKSHNQYVTIGATLGVFGLLIFLAVYVNLLFSYEGSLKFLFWLTQGILSIGMLWEDTFDTQAGVAIFSLWLTLFIFENRIVEDSQSSKLKNIKME